MIEPIKVTTFNIQVALGHVFSQSICETKCQRHAVFSSTLIPVVTYTIVDRNPIPDVVIVIPRMSSSLRCHDQ